MEEMIRAMEDRELEQLARALCRESARRGGRPLPPFDLPARSVRLAEQLSGEKLQEMMRLVFRERAARLLSDVQILPAGSLDPKGLIPESTAGFVCRRWEDDEDGS